MATNHINLFAADNGLVAYKHRFYGVYNSYNICMGYEGSNIVYFFNTLIDETDAFQRLLEQNSADYDIVLYRITPPIVSVVSRSRNIKHVLDYLTALLKMCNATGSEICAFCGEELGNYPTYFEVDGVVCLGHEKCFNKFNYSVNKRALDAKYSEVSASKIIAIPILMQVMCFALICLVYIATKSRAWFFYIMGGFMMGYLSAVSYAQLRGKSGAAFYAHLMPLAAVLMFAAQAVMQAYLIIDNFNFFIGLKIFFVSWGNPVAIMEMLLPQLIVGCISVVCGLLLVDFHRIKYMKNNTVKIQRITR